MEPQLINAILTVADRIETLTSVVVSLVFVVGGVFFAVLARSSK